MAPFDPGGGLTLVQTTGTAGVALVNGTPNILSWTAPNDGNLHRAVYWALLNVSSAQTGGAIQAWFDPAGGGARFGVTIVNGGNAGGSWPLSGVPTQILLKPGGNCVLTQTPQTAGASIVYAEIWAS